MKQGIVFRLSAPVIATMLLGAGDAHATAAAALYMRHCAACHGPGRLGGTGPALIPESLRRLRRTAAIDVIAKGRGATQMRGFAAMLSPPQISSLRDFLYKPLAKPPIWSQTEIEASRSLTANPRAASKPLHAADPLNLFVIVESGDHHVTILDGGSFTPLHRFKTRFALHGGPKFTRDGRYVFFGSRDGWITKYDLWTFEVLGEIRAGINTRNIALSADDKWIVAANYLPSTLVILSAADLSVARVFDVKGRNGASSRVSAIYQALPRGSLIAALKDIPEIWEITPVLHGAEADFVLRRIKVAEPLDDFFFDQSYRHLIGSSRQSGKAVVIDLDKGIEVTRLDMPGLPHLGSGTTWTYRGRRVMAVPHLKEGAISIIDMTDWRLIKRIKTKGPGFFARSHEQTPYLWADVFFGPHKDVIHVIDKRSLEIVRTLRPAPGKRSAHIEFDRAGRHALVSIWEHDGALIVYDALGLKQVKRLPMSKPSGKYNVYNKTTLSEGTSH